MKTLVFDTETTIHEKGNPFSKYNRLVCIGWKALWKSDKTNVVYLDEVYEDFVDDFIECTDIVGFNLKFDLHWLRTLPVGSFKNKRLWDTQLGEYVLSRQQWVYPDLNESCVRRGGVGKIDVVKTEYWDKGINTPDIPREILTEYLINDVNETAWLFEQQARDFRDNPGMFKIYRLSCDDLKVLEEMEASGLKLDVDLCKIRLEETNSKVETLNHQLSKFANGCDINWDSNDDLSTILFGGNLIRETRKVIGYYKTGKNIGMPRYKVEEEYIEFKRMFEPDKSWETKKTKGKSDYELGLAHRNRLYFTNDEVLSKIKDSTGIVALLKDRAKYVKLAEYYEKLPKLVETKGWKDNMLHGQFNQVVTRTGRASSSDPNLQNFAGDVQDVLVSRY